MRQKDGFKKLTILLPKEHYNLLVQRKLLHGDPISRTITEALERERPPVTR
jgi:hypothetical protein